MLVKRHLLADSRTLRRPHALTAGLRRSLHGNRTPKWDKRKDFRSTNSPAFGSCSLDLGKVYWKRRLRRNSWGRETVFTPATCSPGSRQERWRELRKQTATKLMTSVKCATKWEIRRLCCEKGFKHSLCQLSSPEELTQNCIFSLSGLVSLISIISIFDISLKCLHCPVISF